jgi:hypothetical protein
MFQRESRWGIGGDFKGLPLKPFQLSRTRIRFPTQNGGPLILGRRFGTVNFGIKRDPAIPVTNGSFALQTA